MSTLTQPMPRAPRPWSHRLRRLTSGRVLRRIASMSVAAVGVAGVTLVIRNVPQLHDLASLTMLYLLVVIGSAVAFGSVPAVFASVLSFLAIDWYFVGPHSFFTAKNPAEWLALIVFMIVAVTTGQLTGLLRAREEEAKRRARETAALAEASWAIASQVERDSALEQVMRQLTGPLGLRGAAILVPQGGGEFQIIAKSSRQRPGKTRARIEGYHDHVVRFLDGTSGAPPASVVFRENSGPDCELLPLFIENRLLGGLWVELGDADDLLQLDRRVLISLANHASVVLERDRLMQREAQAQALAQADRLKTALLSMVSHDFRSPLASIKASVTGLLQDGLPWEPAPAHELLQAIDVETDRLSRMVANLLALSRLEADAWRPQCDANDVAEVISAALDSFTGEDNQRIQVEMPQPIPEAWFDSVQVVQVLHNVLENALKYSEAPAPVELSATTSGNLLVMEVRDRGCGIPTGHEGRVFDRFYRAPGLGESAVPGLGLGLTVCRGLIEAHDGRLTAANRVGGGAIFRIELPLAPPARA